MGIERRYENKVRTHKIDKFITDLQPHKVSVRMIFPYDTRCISCTNINYAGTKFNGKISREKERYLSFRIYTIKGKCSHCLSTIAFTTDPANRGYKLKEGGEAMFLEPLEVKRTKTTAHSHGLVNIDLINIDASLAEYFHSSKRTRYTNVLSDHYA